MAISFILLLNNCWLDNHYASYEHRHFQLVFNVNHFNSFCSRNPYLVDLTMDATNPPPQGAKSNIHI
jgi:hypothetical protein